MSDTKEKQLAQLTAEIKHYLRSEAAPRIRAAIELASSEAGIPMLPESLDNNKWLLNCPNGTLDLGTGILRPHQREDLITKLCPTKYDPKATCPIWERTLNEIFKGDQMMVLFLQRLFGYCLTGDIREQILPIFFGSGANGKTTVVNELIRVLGQDYAMTANEDLLVKPRGDRHPTELAQLFGMRLVVAAETEEGAQLNEKRIKALTGGDKIRARRMREDMWEFEPTHKVILLTNHKPKVGGGDHAIWRRLRLVPFEETFHTPDRDLPQKFAAEREGILAWMVRGCLDWRVNGLQVPKKIAEATETYRTASEDPIRKFLRERCSVTGDQNQVIKAADLFSAFQRWLEYEQEEQISRGRFGKRLSTEPLIRRFTNNGTFYRGIGLRPQTEAEKE